MYPITIHETDQRERQIVYALKLVAVLTIIAVAAIGAAPTGLAAPARQEAPPERLTYDGVFDAPHLQTDEPSAPSEGDAANADFFNWSRLVFQSARNLHDWEIYGAQGNGSSQIDLSNNPGTDLHPRLNRGATRVAFASNREVNYEIYVMNSDGTSQTRLTNNGSDDVYPAWSPDGSKIAFQAYRNGQAEIYVMNASGSSQTRITNYGDYDGQPAWSPDGSKITFVRKVSGQYHVWVMNADGSNPQQRSGQAYSQGPVWSPDGTKIAYDSDGNGDGWQEVWLMNSDGSGQRQIYDPEGNTDAWVRGWSPDGRYIAFTRISWIQQGGIWYWTRAYLDACDTANPASTIRLSGNGQDWHPGWETTDAQVPVSAVQSLPVQSPGPFTVRWSGADSGGSGFLSFDIQVKDGPNGAWSDWKTNTTETSASFSGVGGHTYYFRSRGRDNAYNLEPWPTGHDAVTTVEALPPQTSVWPLPPHGRNGLIVHWGGSDPGGSGIDSYDVQYREGNGVWTDWETNTANTSAQFVGTAGVEYRFRARARDMAHNQEAWPRVADTSVVLHTWAVTGRATDNRGAPVVGVQTTTDPAAFGMNPSDGEGVYGAYVSANANGYTAVWSKPAYGALPITVFAADVDAAVDPVMPPADDVVLNGGFEDGSNHWDLNGDLTATITETVRHSGDAAAFVGSIAVPLSSIVPLANLGYVTNDYAPSFAIDPYGGLHVVWVPGEDQPVLYRYKPPSGPWTDPQPVSTSTARASGLEAMFADATGAIHVAWCDGDQESLQYSFMDYGGSWSNPEIVPGSANLCYQQPLLALGNNHVLKALWPSGRQLRFAERSPNGVWSAIQVVAYNYAGFEQLELLTDHAGFAHAIWNAKNDSAHHYNVYYTSEDGNGGWLPPVVLSPDINAGSLLDMSIEQRGTVHAFWTADGNLYHRMRLAGNVWTPYEVIAVNTADFSSFIDEKDQVHLVWGDWVQDQVQYSVRMGGAWSASVGVAPPATGSSPSTFHPNVWVDELGQVHVIWSLYLINQLHTSVGYSKQTASGSWQPRIGIREVDHWIGKPQVVAGRSGTPHAVWIDAGNVTYAGPELVVTTGDASVSQGLQAPIEMAAPTLSFLYSFDSEFPSDSRLETVVNSGVSPTVVFSATANTEGWTHQWVDLTPWAGETINVQFQVIEESGGSRAGAYVDEVTVGSARPDTWVTLPGSFAVPAGRQFDLDISYGNRGGVAASNGWITLELPAELAFISAEPPPSATSPVLRWDVGDLAGQGAAQLIRVRAQVAGGAPYGTTLAASAAIASQTGELEQLNNAAACSIFIGSLHYLPLILRS